ncbi:MAG TPA: ABC transporter permease [Bryobacteraceae bacterium]|nr:ABC transporter permease [Bryobacteraceae bacterium]
MLWLEKIRVCVQMLFNRGREIERLDTEIHFHLEQMIADNIAAGMSPAEARAAALRAFRNPALLGEQARETWTWTKLELAVRDLQRSIRTLARTPGFAALAIVVLALGVGANVALFTVARSVLWKPLPFRDPQRLIRFYEVSSDDKFPYNSVAGGIFAEWRKHSHAFSDLAILADWPSGYNLSSAGGQLPERVRATKCSWTLFPTLGVQPALGRTFTAADDQLSANATVVLSWAFWQRRFGGDPAILNQTIKLHGSPYTVIGVMPPWFAYPNQSIQLWTPLYHEAPPEWIEAPDSHDFIAIGRLKPGVGEKQAATELSLIVRRVHDQHLDNPFVSKAANTRPLLEDIAGDFKRPIYILLAATVCVLLIACLNLANLLVARAAARKRELAIRTAIGGSRRRLVSGQFLECLLLSAAGGALGLLLASAAVRWLVSVRPDVSRMEAVHIDSIVVAFTLALVLLCTIFSGAISSLSASGGNILAALQESSRSSTGGPARTNLRKILLSMEVGITVVLLIAAGLLLKSYGALRLTKIGCLTQNVLTMRFSLPETLYARPAQRAAFFENLLVAVRSLPGLQAAGLTTSVPGRGYPGDNGFVIPGRPLLPAGQLQYAIRIHVDPGYFAALGIPILRGQAFGPDARLEHATKTIVSDAFVRRYFPNEDPLGKHLITLGEKTFEIVGVAADTRYQVNEPVEPIMYFPLYSGSESAATLAVRSTGDVSLFALTIQRTIARFDPDLAVSDILTMNQLIGESTIEARFDATLLLAFASLSLTLAAVGLFGVLSYIVAQRTTEIGVRIALGAPRETVFRLVLFDGLRPALAGFAVGIIASTGAAHLIQSMLFGVRPFDPSVFLAITAVLLAASAAACAIPAWRASHLDPISALRSE